MKQLLFLALLFSFSSLSAQLLNDDEFTPKGAFTFEEGSTMPNLKFMNLKSQRFDLYDKLEKLTVVEFWYTTCKSCVENKKYLDKFSTQFNINIVSVAIDEKPSTVRRYIADNHILWDNIQENNAFKGFYNKTKGVATPTYLVINTDKEIIKVFDDGEKIGKMGVFLQGYFK